MLAHRLAVTRGADQLPQLEARAGEVAGAGSSPCEPDELLL